MRECSPRTHSQPTCGLPCGVEADGGHRAPVGQGPVAHRDGRNRSGHCGRLRPTDHRTFQIEATRIIIGP